MLDDRFVRFLVDSLRKGTFKHDPPEMTKEMHSQMKHEVGEGKDAPVRQKYDPGRMTPTLGHRG